LKEDSGKQNYRQRFLLPDIGVWGASVRLTSAWTEILGNYDYQSVVASRLGEALAASVLLTTHLKREGSLIVQTQSDGPLHTLVAQAKRDGTIRGLARSKGNVADGDLAQVFGEGKLVMTMDNEQDERYQGIVALQGARLSEALETYFSQSEQLATRLWLEADLGAAAGFLLQKLPADERDNGYTAVDMDVDENAQGNWNRVTILADTLRPRELLESSSEAIVHRLFHQEKVRRFVPEELRFYCSCSSDRIEAMLKALGPEEVESILKEQGLIEVDCEFCNRQYQLAKQDVDRLFENDESDTDPQRQLH